MLTKNLLNETTVEQNCNKANIKIKGNQLIKFRNCKITLQDKTFENFEITIHDKIILPNFATRIKENKVVHKLDLNDLFIYF